MEGNCKESFGKERQRGMTLFITKIYKIIVIKLYRNYWACSYCKIINFVILIFISNNHIYDY